MKRLSFAGAVVSAWLLLTAMPVQAEETEQHIRGQLLRLQPDLKIEQVSIVQGSALYQVQLAGGQFLYVDKTAEFMLHGELYQIRDGGAVNLTGEARQGVTAALMAGLDAQDMVIFPADGDKKSSVTVFTDVDCGFCQKLHNEVPELNKAGVEVRYLGWPRQGLSGKTYDTMVSIWCADDQQEAMTKAKRRESVEPATCKTPLDRQYALGQQLGIRGTPAIVLENGEVLPGYMPAAQLVARALQAQQ